MGSMRLMRVFGIDLRVHSTFLLALGLGAFQWSHFGARGAGFGVLLVALLFVCVVLHELGHSLVARGFGIPVREIILLPIGGMAQMTGKPKSPAQELLIAIVGPLVNVAIALALTVGGVAWLGREGAVQAFSELGSSPPSLQTMWVMMTASNVMLAVFNMLPALPMDGGRVLRSVLAMGLGQSKATRIAAVVARVLAVAMVLFALLTGQLMLGLIGLFVFFGANAEANEERMTGALQNVTVEQALNPRAVTLTPDTTLAAAIQWLVRNPQQAFAVLHSGRLVGVVTRRGLLKAAQEQGPYGYVAAVMERQVPTLPPASTLTQARQLMNTSVSAFVAVVSGDEFLGLITEQELASAITASEVFERFQKPGSSSRLAPH